MNNLKEAENIISKAVHPEDIFGKIEDSLSKEDKLKTLKQEYNKICKITHEDLYKLKTEKILAHELFIIANRLYKIAESKIKDSSYGKIKNVKIGEYELKEFNYVGDISNLAHGLKDKKNYLLKISSSIGFNDLLENESDNLNILKKATDDPKLLQHLPDIVESFKANINSENLNINVFSYKEKLVSLAKVIQAYPDGIDIRDAAWMINRVLIILKFTHDNEIVHGCIIPEHILIEPETHNAVLVDWCYSVKNKQPLKTIVSRYKYFYPSEIFDKKPVDSGLDMYMLAATFNKLIGGNIIDGKFVFKKDTPKPIINLIRSCSLGYTYREKDALTFFKDFKEVLKNLYGDRKFREFKM